MTAMDIKDLKKIIETLLFITDAPLDSAKLSGICGVGAEKIEEALGLLASGYEKSDGALQIVSVAGGWQMSTRPEFAVWVRRLYQNKITVRLTQAALETLCIIAYKQPVTRAELEAVRGVDTSGPLDTLLQRKLIEITGRRESLGRPMLYGTTPEFLRQFGLKGLSDLPRLDSAGGLNDKDEAGSPVLAFRSQPENSEVTPDMFAVPAGLADGTDKPASLPDGVSGAVSETGGQICQK